MTCISENGQHASEFLNSMHYWKGWRQWLLVLFVFSGHWFTMVLLPLMVVLVKVLLVAVITMPCKLTQITRNQSSEKEVEVGFMRCWSLSLLAAGLTPATLPSGSAPFLSFSMSSFSAPPHRWLHLPLCPFLHHSLYTPSPLLTNWVSQCLISKFPGKETDWTSSTMFWSRSLH